MNRRTSPSIAEKAAKHARNPATRGASAFFEMMMINDVIRDLIHEQAATLTIKEAAMAQGMRTLREHGIQAILDGHSTAEEVLKYT